MSRIDMLKIKISELACSLKQVEKEITDQSQVSFFHIIKLMVFDSPENYNHWREEVAGNFHEVKRLKGKNRYLIEVFIFETIWNANGDRIEDIICYLKKEEKGLPVKEYNIQNIEDILYVYFHWLAERLSKNSFVSNSEIYAKLNELGVSGGSN